MKYYVLIKRKGSSKWLGAIPAKAGVSLTKLRQSIKNGSKQFMYKIVSAAALKRQIMRMKPGMKRKVGKRRRVRKVKRRPMRRRKVRKVRRVKRRMKKPMRRVKRRFHRRTHRKKRR